MICHTGIESSAAGFIGLQRTLGIPFDAIFIPYQFHRDLPASLTGEPGHDPTVASIVAGATNDLKLLRLLPCLDQQGESAAPCPLHKFPAADLGTRHRLPVHLPNLVAAVNIPGVSH